MVLLLRREVELGELKRDESILRVCIRNVEEAFVLNVIMYPKGIKDIVVRIQQRDEDITSRMRQCHCFLGGICMGSLP